MIAADCTDDADYDNLSRIVILHARLRKVVIATDFTDKLRRLRQLSGDNGCIMLPVSRRYHFFTGCTVEGFVPSMGGMTLMGGGVLTSAAAISQLVQISLNFNCILHSVGTI